MPTFNLQIVTPEREVLNALVDSITLPGTEGSFGVLANHAPLIAAIQPGLVRIKDAEMRELRMCVGGGFFQVSKNQAMLLADSAELATDVDLERAKLAEARASERLAGKLTTENLQRERAESSLARARARMRVASSR